MEKKGSISLGKEALEFYKNYDLSLSNTEVSNDSYINGLIKAKLGDFSDKWFVEFSVLATTIDPLRTIGSTGNLRCFSFIQDNGQGEDGDTFKDKIEKYISPIISVLKNRAHNDNWWFHNPETFLDFIVDLSKEYLLTKNIDDKNNKGRIKLKKNVINNNTNNKKKCC